jgi:triacylglycerol lipase
MSDFVQFPLADYDKAGFEKFDGRVSAFALKNAYAMMWFAQLAYEVDTSGANSTAAKIDTIRGFWKFNPVTTFRAQTGGIPVSFNTTGVFGERADAVVLAFAGTDPAVWETLATDFNPPIGPSHTHVGFQAAMDAVRNDIDAAVALSRASGKPLFIAGHSLGGALAGLAALRAAEGDQAPRAVYVFGMPRAGDKDFRDAYNAKLGNVTYRLAHGRDIVSRVPPSWVKYCHVGRAALCATGAKFAEGSMSAGLSDAPDIPRNIVGGLITSITGGGFFQFAGDALMGRVRSPADVFAALSKVVQPAGHGPLGESFRFLPPEIREHLQDEYIDALKP